jgi:HK97 family phage major capsid protein
MNELQLRKAGAEKVAAARAIQDLAAKEARATSVEETNQIQALLEESQKLLASADVSHKLDLAEAGLKAPAPRKVEASSGDALPPAEAKDHEKEARSGFADFGEYAETLARAMTPGGNATATELKMLSAASGMSQGVGSEGGYTVPPAFSTTIWDGLNQGVQNILGLTDNYTITGESLTFLANAETSRVAGSRYGGIQGYWISEAGQITSSKPKVRQLKVEPHQLAALVYVTDKLLRNSQTALEQYITRAAIEELNFLIGDAIINGTGVGQPLGILNSTSKIEVAKETSQVAATVVEGNLSKMWQRMHPRSRPNAVWLINTDVEPSLDALNQKVLNVAGTENVGGYKSTIYNPETNTIKGRPVILCEFCPTVGTVGDVILADMKGYVTGTRGAPETAMSIHLRFDYAESVFRFIFEVDGQPWLSSALTPFKGSSTQSAFITTAVRA